jgi:16S rRNA (cytidine1402-2'-O)-methyltransferase
VALVSDAGTPAISDPGAMLVRAVLAAGMRVIPVPGASSMTAALSVAGIRTTDIHFVGFAPARTQARRRHWQALAAASGATVVFEAPHRMAATARELSGLLDPHRRIVIARELTKHFETIIETTAGQLCAVIEHAPPRGEYVLVIDAMPVPTLAGAPAGQTEDGADPPIDSVTARWLAELATALPAARAAAIAARASGLPRDVLYRALSARTGPDIAPE